MTLCLNGKGDKQLQFPLDLNLNTTRMAHVKPLGRQCSGKILEGPARRGQMADSTALAATTFRKHHVFQELELILEFWRLVRELSRRSDNSLGAQLILLRFPSLVEDTKNAEYDEGKGQRP